MVNSVESEDKKALIIYDSIEFFLPYFKEKGFSTHFLFKDIPWLLKFFRKIWLLLNLPKKYWYAEWTKKIKDHNTIIVFATPHLEALHYIKRENPNARIIFWYWNPVYRKINPKLVPTFCEIWSFDKKDCEDYNLKFNTTFYFNNIHLKVSSVKYDLMFVGLDKGRRGFLNNFKLELENLKLMPYLYIVDDDFNKKNYQGNHPPIAYADYLEVLSKSNAILDFLQEGQDGLTLRPMESIFFQKKLITNDLNIVKYDFYNKSNVFILGRDALEDLPRFLNSPYESLNKELVNSYDVTSWFSRFSS